MSRLPVLMSALESTPRERGEYQVNKLSGALGQTRTYFLGIAYMLC